MDGTMLFAAFGALGAGIPLTTAADLSWVRNAYTVRLHRDDDPIRRVGRLP